MKKLIVTLIGCLILIVQLDAQTCDLFFDDFSNAGLWTPVGANVLVNNDRAEFQNNASNGLQRRIHRPLNITLNSNDAWTANVDFHVTSAPTGATGHNPLSLTAGQQEPFSDCQNIACTNYPQGTQDAIMISYVTTTPVGTDRGFVIKAREGSTTIEYTSAARIDALGLDTTYYLTLERLSPTLVNLAVFSDPSRTNQLPGSPVTLTIPNTIDGINTVQVNNAARGNPNRQFNGWSDNICISPIQECNLFADDFSDGALWTTVGTDVVVNNGTAEFQNNAANGTQKRIHQAMGTTLNSNDIWSADVEFHIDSAPTGATGHSPICLTAGTQEPFSDCPDLICTGVPNGTQDGIFITFVTSSPVDSDRGFVIKAREGSTSTEYTSTKVEALSFNTTHYLTLERLTPTKLILGVFSDPSRTTHLPGSPVSLTIPASIDGLNTVQVNSAARGNPNRQLNGWVDNICISGDITLPVENKPFVEHDINIFPNPSDRLVNIQIDNPSNNKMAVRVVDGLGRYVWKSGLIKGQSEWNKALEIEGTGMYFVLVQIGEEMYTRRLVIVD